MRKSERGSAVIWFLLVLPAIMAILGLLMDGGLIVFHQIQLDMATEAASVATISTYDKDLWASSKRVKLNEIEARNTAEIYLKKTLIKRKFFR